MLEHAFRKHKRAIGTNWRMEETCIKVTGAWTYRYQAGDKQGQTVDFLLTPRRDAAARRIFEKAIRHNTVPDKVTKDEKGANQAALKQLNQEREVPMTIWQVNYRNNDVEQNHRAIKHITRPMLGFKSFRAAPAILAGIEQIRMIRESQFMLKREGMWFANQLDASAGQRRLA
jgi:transposase-like protein